MDRTVTILALLPVLAASAAAQAHTWELRFNAGLAVPAGGDPGVRSGFVASYSSGFTLGAGIGRNLNSALYVGACLDYSRFPLDEQGYLGGSTGTVTGGEQSIISVGLDLRYALGGGASSLSPYLVAGLSGLNLSDVTLSESGAGGSQQITLTTDGLFQDLAIHMAAGTQLRVGPSAQLVFEARAVIGTAGQASYIPVRMGAVMRP
jgi:hypothetical protein